jgi:hypothetical protein
VLIYGSETCVVGKQVENLFRSFEREVLRKMFVPVLENACWRKCKNSEKCKICEEYDVKYIKLGRIRWAGHMMRMEEVILQRKAFLPNQEEMQIGGEAGQSGGGATS